MNVRIWPPYRADQGLSFGVSFVRIGEYSYRYKGICEMNGIFEVHFAMVIRGVGYHGHNDNTTLSSSARAFRWYFVRQNWANTHGDIHAFVYT